MRGSGRLMQLRKHMRDCSDEGNVNSGTARQLYTGGHDIDGDIDVNAHE